MKKYDKIIRSTKTKVTDNVLQLGDNIVVTEKIDASNASFLKDGQGNMRAFSRNKELDEHNTLNGFYNWVQEELDPDVIPDDFIYFGEWTGNPHKVKYPDYEKCFFLFDVYSLNLEEYLSFPIVSLAHDRIADSETPIYLVPLFYEGEYKGMEHLQEYVGKTDIGGELKGQEQGEGIVIKNYMYTDSHDKQVFIKMVSDVFSEMQNNQQKKKHSKPDDPVTDFVYQFTTQARVDKAIYKLIDRNLIPVGFDFEDLGNVLKNVVPFVVEDLLQEELSEDINKDEVAGEVKRACSKIVPPYVRNHILER